MEEQIKHFILQLFFARNNPKTFSKVIRDMRKAHDDAHLQKITDTIKYRINKEGLGFVAPATDNDAFKQQVLGAINILEKTP
jgi:hypothetical protein